MNHTILSLCAIGALAAAAAAQYPTSSTLPRGEVLLTAAPTNNDVIGFGFWRTCSPVEKLPAGPAGTAPTAQVAYVSYGEGTLGAGSIMFRRTTDGGRTWGAPQVLYTTVAGEAIDGAETRLVGSGHEVFLVFASNAHTLIAGHQAVFAMGSADQGQTWSAPVLLSTDSIATLRDADEVNAACSRANAGAAASLNVVFESDYKVPVSGTEDLYFVQAEMQGGSLVITQPNQRLNLQVAAHSTDVNFTSIAAQGPVVHVAWTDNRQGGGTSQYDYFSMTSRANGSDWATTTEYRHTTFPAPLTWAAPRRPQVAVDLPNVYTFMEHSFQFGLFANAEDDVRMDWSADLGVTWPVTDVPVNTATIGNGGDIDDMFVVARDGKVAVVYVDDRLNGINDNDNNQAIVAVSHNAGLDFQFGLHTEVPLSLKDPNPIYGIDMAGDMIAVVYETRCTGTGEDFAISLSADGGQTFKHYDVTNYGACGTYPSGVDVDDPRMTLTRNGDVIVTWIDDRTVLGAGGGNTINNTYVTSLHYPQLIDNTATFQGLSYQDDSPANAGNPCIVLLSFSGTTPPITFDNLGFQVPLAYDVFTDLAIVVAFSAPAPTVNSDYVGATGSVVFPFFPNVTQLFGLPIRAAAMTINLDATPGKFTDAILFQ
ncbi:MAG: exo-alpha-sialidase [Planctomycetes bacterium]|nr:exo-alpha-sialidase [Planctomycetota bacterium]